jgi:hypothetical protein
LVDPILELTNVEEETCPKEEKEFLGTGGKTEAFNIFSTRFRVGPS